MQDLAPILLSVEEKIVLMPLQDNGAYVQTLLCSKETTIKAVSKTVWRFLDPRDITVVWSNEKFSAKVNGFGVQVVGRTAILEKHAFSIVRFWSLVLSASAYGLGQLPKKLKAY